MRDKKRFCCDYVNEYILNNKEISPEKIISDLTKKYHIDKEESENIVNNELNIILKKILLNMNQKQINLSNQKNLKKVCYQRYNKIPHRLHKFL